jgi:hypothetical protein
MFCRDRPTTKCLGEKKNEIKVEGEEKKKENEEKCFTERG